MYAVLCFSTAIPCLIIVAFNEKKSLGAFCAYINFIKIPRKSFYYCRHDMLVLTMLALIFTYSAVRVCLYGAELG